MTVASAVNRKTYTGDDATTSFATSPVVFYDTSDLIVYVTNDTTGVATLLAEGTTYSVSGGSGSTGTVDLSGGSAPHGALLSGTTLVIIRDIPLLQEADFVQNDASDAEVAEAALDKIVMGMQRLDDRMDRSMVISDGDISGADFTVPTPVASSLIGWASDGLSLANYVLTDLTVSAVPAYALDIITAADDDAFFATMVDGMTAETAPAVGDLIALADVSLTPDDGRKMTLENMLKVVNGLTADALPVRSTDYLLSYDASASGPKKVLMQDFPFMPKHSSGLTYSNNGTDATNDIDIAAGSARDAADAVNLVLTSALTKQSDVAWAVGTNAGGLDTGAVGNSDYYIWLIKRSDTGVVDVLFSLSSTAPTMPANYDFKRLIGWFKRVGGTIVAFTTYETEGGGIELLWSSPTLDIDLAATLTTSRRTDAVKVPLNFSVLAYLSVYMIDAASQTSWVYCPDQADLAPSGSAAPLSNVFVSSAVGNGAQQMTIRTSATGTIAARSNVATVDNYRVATMGFAWARRN